MRPHATASTRPAGEPFRGRSPGSPGETRRRVPERAGDAEPPAAGATEASCNVGMDPRTVGFSGTLNSAALAAAMDAVRLLATSRPNSPNSRPSSSIFDAWPGTACTIRSNVEMRQRSSATCPLRSAPQLPTASAELELPRAAAMAPSLPRVALRSTATSWRTASKWCSSSSVTSRLQRLAARASSTRPFNLAISLWKFSVRSSIRDSTSLSCFSMRRVNSVSFRLVRSDISVCFAAFREMTSRICWISSKVRSLCVLSSSFTCAESSCTCSPISRIICS
mmetsp:Transcript_41125/g.118302  ORF Transcript_41125/g.118302 Transcript_41125/m.118302 type:complete len:280 (-) Transcript_41125:134-973(-)